MNRVLSRWDTSRMPAQWDFFTSPAKIRGYGGAMGGGKTRALMELAWDLLLVHPGIRVVCSRLSHVDIVGSSRKLFIEQVMVPEAVEGKKESQGEDWFKLYNKSEVHFTGLDNPVKKFSTESGFWIFDEAHEIPESTVVLCNTRLRQRCLDCIREDVEKCSHYPHGMAFGFNPENPDHWLHRWFIDGAPMSTWDDGSLRGYAKPEIWPKDSSISIGDGEFIFARAYDNPYLHEEYIEQNLKGLPETMRRRYLEGEWLYVEGMSFFDAEAMYALQPVMPKTVCRLFEEDGRAKLRPDRLGGWWIWEPPVREREVFNDDLNEWDKSEAHRYVVSVDVSSGTSNDYGAIQVVDVTTLEQVAEYQGRIPTTDLAAQAILIARVYNMAMIVPEVTGGWGFTVVAEIQRLKYPRVYTRTIFDRLSRKFTDVMGWDTNLKTRAIMLNTLERLVREEGSGIRSSRLKAEMNTFVYPKVSDTGGPYQGVPQAQPGANDDLVMSYAIGITVALSLPRELRKIYYPRGAVKVG